MVALAGNAVALHIHEEQCGGSIDERINMSEPGDSFLPSAKPADPFMSPPLPSVPTDQIVPFPILPPIPGMLKLLPFHPSNPEPFISPPLTTVPTNQQFTLPPIPTMLNIAQAQLEDWHASTSLFRPSNSLPSASSIPPPTVNDRVLPPAPYFN